jgi:glucose/arabinose dehydrogenase
MTPRRLACALALALLAYAAPSASAAIHLTPIADFSLPVHVATAPGDPHRLFVVEQGGRIMEVRDGQKITAPFLDIASSVRSGGEQGLLSMAFAPDYATSRKFYVYYTAPRPGDGSGSVITVQEFQTVAGNPDAVDPASRRTVLTVDHPTNGNHNGGQLQFGPDGALYAGTGDGGSGNDPPNNAQNPSSQLGKLLRIDRVNGGASIFALGLRNPWRFSFDRQTGDLVIGDVGQNAFEEVDFTPAGTGAGLNYGWRCFEGFHPTGLSCATPAPAMTPPVIEKDQAATGFCAIVGGYVVRDPALGALNGRYLYGDNCASEIRSAALVAPPARVTDDTDTGLRVSGLTSFGQDYCGHVYTASGAGTVSRIDGDSFTPCAEGGTGAGGGDTRAPRVRIGGRKRQRVARQRGLRIAVSCDETCGATISGKVRIARSKKRYVLKTTTRQLSARKRVKVKLKVSKRARSAIRRALRRHRRVKLGIRVVARDAAANQALAGKTFRARR